jgi:hypothetical protein
MSTDGETLQVSVLPDRWPIYPPLVTYLAPDERFSHALDSLGRWSRLARTFRSAQAATLLEVHVPLTDGSVWLTVWNLYCTITIDSVLTNSKTHNSFSFPAHAMLRHDSLPPTCETCKYTTVPGAQKHFERFCNY